MKKKPRVLVVGLGGAISASLKKGFWDYGAITLNELVGSTQGLKENFDVHAFDLFRMVSADITPRQWLTLANTIYHKLPNYDGVVITMGTDTLCYASYALAFLVQRAGVPLVFTGAQLDSGHLNTDARRNLLGAVAVAGLSDIAETLVYFNGKIMRAVRCKKTNATGLDAFSAFGDGLIGVFEQEISLQKAFRKRRSSKPLLYYDLDIGVVLVKVYPGFDGKRLVNLVKSGVSGIVLEGFGLGDLPLIDTGLKEAIRFANSQNVPVVVASGIDLGTYWEKNYKVEIGSRLNGLGVIRAFDMLSDVAYVKLMWVLGITKDLKKVKSLMEKNVVGEFGGFYEG